MELLIILDGPRVANPLAATHQTTKLPAISGSIKWIFGNVIPCSKVYLEA